MDNYTIENNKDLQVFFEKFDSFKSKIKEIDFLKNGLRFNFILLIGESGTGKTTLARLIHDRLRGNNNFFNYQCSYETTEVLECKIFGYERGAFTSSIGPMKGLIQQASKGTLFIDDIHNLTLPLQTKFIKLTDSRHSYTKYNDNKEILAEDVLFIFSCHNINQVYKTNKFKNDLYHRIAVWQFEISPLRDHPESIISYAEMFIRVEEEKIASGIFQHKVLADEAKQKLMNHDYIDSNLHELAKVIRKAMAFSNIKSKIHANDIIFYNDQNIPEKRNSVPAKNIDYIGLAQKDPQIDDNYLENISVETLNDWRERKVFIELNKYLRTGGLWNINSVCKDIFKEGRGAFHTRLNSILLYKLKNYNYDMIKVSDWAKERKISYPNLKKFLENLLTSKLGKQWTFLSQKEFEENFAKIFKTSTVNATGVYLFYLDLLNKTPPNTNT